VAREGAPHLRVAGFAGRAGLDREPRRPRYLAPAVGAGLSPHRLPTEHEKELLTLEQGEAFRVLVTGSRTWVRVRRLTGDLEELRAVHGRRLVVVHGAASRGADAIAEAWCRRTGTAVERFPADWSTGRAAGFRRNVAMVSTLPDLCLAYIRDSSPGATHCARLAELAGIPTRRERHEA
jgi:hypothetical protein